MSVDQSNWNEQYRTDLEAYVTCAKKLESLLLDLLTEAGIDVVDVESRAKDPASFQRKVEGKKDAYPTPLEDVTDLIGVRVIAYYLEDVARISDLIGTEFVVDANTQVTSWKT
jgi:putative GTP pyrophosphokinase